MATKPSKSQASSKKPSSKKTDRKEVKSKIAAPKSETPKSKKPTAKIVPAKAVKSAAVPALKKPTLKAKSGKASSVSLDLQPPIDEPVISHDEISLRAYFIAERRHKMGWPGNSGTDWADAISQLRAEALEKPLKKR